MPNARRLSVPEAWREIGRAAEKMGAGRVGFAFIPPDVVLQMSGQLLHRGSWDEAITGEPGAVALACYLLALEAEEA